MSTATNRPPDSDYEKARLWMQEMDRYPRVAPAQIPNDGVYWLRCASPVHRAFTTDHPQGRWVAFSWIDHVIGEWFIGQVESGRIETLGSDETIEWSSHWSVVVEVGDEIKPPPLRA